MKEPVAIPCVKRHQSGHQAGLFIKAGYHGRYPLRLHQAIGISGQNNLTAGILHRIRDRSLFIGRLHAIITMGQEFEIALLTPLDKLLYYLSGIVAGIVINDNDFKV